MKLFEIVFGNGNNMFQFANTRRELRKRYWYLNIVEINRVEIH